MELLSQSRTKPNLDQIRKIKATLRQALKLSDEDTITVTELACLEEDCAPLETVIGLLQDDHPQIQHKIHKPTNSIDTNDLTEVCKAWGFDSAIMAFITFDKEI